MSRKKVPKKDGGPAFPNGLYYGASLRDVFAWQALAGLCANPGGPFQANSTNGWSIVNCTTDDVAQECYRVADAMLKARGQ